MKKIQEDKLSALLDRLPTSVKRAFMSKTEKQKDINMTNARDAYYDLPKHIRAKIDAMIDPDTGRVKAGANSEELGENLASDINKEGYKEWKYTDLKGNEYYAYGKDENGAKYYLQLKAKFDPNLASKLDDIDTSQIKATGLGVGYVDPYLKAIYKMEIDTLEKKELPLFITENKTKMNKKDLMEMIREVIAEESETVGITFQLPNEPGTNKTPPRFVIGSITQAQKTQLMRTGVGFNADSTQGTPIENTVEGDVIRNALLRNGADPDRVNQIDPKSNYTVKDQGKSLLVYLSNQKVTENKTKMKVNQLRQIIREEISKVLMEADMSGYTAVSTTDSGGTKTYKDSGMDKVAQALADAMNDQSSEESPFNKFTKNGTVKNVPMEVFNAVISNNMESLSPEFKKWIKYNISDIDEPIEFIEVSTTNGSNVVGLRTSYHLGAAQSNKDASAGGWTGD